MLAFTPSLVSSVEFLINHEMLKRGEHLLYEPNCQQQIAKDRPSFDDLYKLEAENNSQIDAICQT